MASLEQTKLLANIAGSPNESGELRNELVRLSTELSSHVKQLEQRTLQNEQRLLKEEVAMATLAQLMQETERKVVEIQRQLDAERREQKECRAALGERLQQLEHRQAQLAEFGRKTNEALSTGVKRMGKELRALSTRVETLGGSVVGQMSGFYHRQSVLVRAHICFTAAVIDPVCVCVCVCVCVYIHMCRRRGCRLYRGSRWGCNAMQQS